LKTLALIALVALAGCNATMPQQHRPTAADDPSVKCFAEMETDQRFAILRPHIGSMTRANAASLEVLASTARPTDQEKRAISVWGVARQTCAAMGDSFRAQYAPPGWKLAVDDGQQQVLGLMARLYAGEITYGEFARGRQAIASEIGQRMQEADQRNTAALAQQAAARSAQAANNAANTALIMQMLRPQPAPMLVQPQQVCRTRRIGNQLETVCN
jgi:hypothetical protein